MLLIYLVFGFQMLVIRDQHCCHLLCRDSTEEPMELSEDERSELMKKESSRLLKTGHRVSYSPRKEKALKIYLDGGPAKDPGQDWGKENHSWLLGLSGCCCRRATRLQDSCVGPDSHLNIQEHREAYMPPVPGLAQKSYCALWCIVL